MLWFDPDLVQECSPDVLQHAKCQHYAPAPWSWSWRQWGDLGLAFIWRWISSSIYSPRAAQVWSEHSVRSWDYTVISGGNCTLSGLDQCFWPPVQLIGSQLSSVNAVFSILSCWWIWDHLPRPKSYYNSLKSQKRLPPFSVNTSYKIAPLTSANLLFCPLWRSGLKDEKGRVL